MADLPAAAPADHSVRDRMVAVLFAIGIALPGLALTWTWSRTLTRFENRSAAPWPAFGWSRDFPAAFDAAFSDRFGGRDALVQFHHGALLRMFGVSSLSTVIARHEGNISNLRIVNRSMDFFDMVIDVEVADVKHLADITAALRATPAINAVERARN